MMYLYVRVIDFAFFYDICIGLWNCSENPAFSSLMTRDRIFGNNNTTGASCGVETTYPSEHMILPRVFSGVCVYQSIVFCVVFCISLFVL
jgi:hypothetical protein